MLEAAVSSLTRTDLRRLLGLGACLTAVLAALIFAGVAHAAEPSGAEGKEPVSTEQTPSAPPAEPVVEEPATPPTSEPVAEETPTPPPAEEPATPPTSEPVAEETPTPPPAEAIIEEPVTPPTIEAITDEALAPAEDEHVVDETTARSGSSGTVDAHSPPAPVEGEGEIEDEAPPETPIGLTVSPTAASQGQPTLASSAAVPAGDSPGRAAGALNGQQSESLSCALSGLGGFAPGSCGATLFGPQIFLSQSAVGFAGAGADSQSATAAVPNDAGHGGSTADVHPAGQSPGPAPGGASGGSAVGGSAGCSSCLTLAGLLRLSGPRAMRRLRLSCEPWLTACFVLIPERPG
jgi:hypothetical protein